MSLGWQTESALLPNKAKPIHVDSKSMMSLKAVVYRQEQQLKLKASSTMAASSSSGKTYHRHIRSIIHPSSKTDDIGTNDHKRRRPQESEEAVVDDDTRAQLALEAKAKLYETIAKGDMRGDSSLVDFGKKRSRVEEDVTEGDEILSSDLSNAVGEQQPALSSRAKPVAISHEYGPQQWQWSKSSSDTKSSNETYLSERAAERQYQREVERQMDEERQRAAPSMMSNDARVKTQWEKTLNSSAKHYLQQIHAETQASRSSDTQPQQPGSVPGTGSSQLEGGRKSAREEKLEMLRRKREHMASLTQPQP